jgi:hypothetical protein
MSLDTTSINKSFLSNNKYELIFDRLPNTTFFLQSVNLPSITLNSVITQTPFVQVNTPGNILTFEQLSITYIVDENMQAWRDIYTWITQMGNPTSHDKLGDLTTALGRSNSMVSDAVLLVKSNSNNPNLKFSFKNIFPTELGSLQFTSTETQEFLTTTGTFFYDYYTLDTV